MMIKWRNAGEKMGTVDLGTLKGDQIVIHYGGALTSVDAYTFANSLIAFSDTVRAVNQYLDPNQGIEIRLEAIDTGSFRAILRRIPKGLGGFLSRGAEAVFWSLIGSLIYDKLVHDDPTVVIHVSQDQVIIEKNGDRIIIPKIIYDQVQNLRHASEVQKQISKTFEIIENDQAVENFGITPRIEDEEPLFQFNREEFPKLSAPIALPASNPSFRERRENARVVILKAWLKRGTQKWSFEWNGYPISAPIKDQEFFTRLENREFLIGSGDALDVELYYIQEFKEDLGIYVNDASTFQIEKVIKIVPHRGMRQLRIDD